MKRENCVEVKYVNNLSVAYLSRFFGSVGAVVKIEKEEVSKYVTIQFAHKNSVERSLRFNGRVLDERPLKIRRFRDKSLLEPLLPPEAIMSEDPLQQPLSAGEQGGLVQARREDLWGLIEDEVKPHQFEANDHILLSMLLWCLIDLLLSSAQHISRFRVNMRSSHLKLELEKLIIDRITRRNANVITFSEGVKAAVLEWKSAVALVWFSVPYPNTEEEQSKVEAASLINKCIATLRHYLSLRLADIVRILNSASLCHNLQETPSEELLTLLPPSPTTEEDNFIGVVENLGSKNIFHEYLTFELPNTCIYLRESRQLNRFECTLRLKGCGGQELRDASWCNLYSGQLIKKVFAKHGEFYLIENKEKIEQVVLGEHSLIFENGQFSLQQLEAQLSIFKEVENFKGLVFYVAKELILEKFHQFKKIYEDDIIKIEEEVEQIETVEKAPKSAEKYEQQPDREEVITDIILIEMKSDNSSAFNNLKLAHYLEEYIQESITGKGLIIASREMAIKLAGNIIEREKENRLFEFGDKRYDQYIGEELWRVYSRQGERKAKNLLAKYSLSL